MLTTGTRSRRWHSGEWVPLDSLDWGGTPGSAGQAGRREYVPTMRNPYATTFMQSSQPHWGTAYWRSAYYPSIAPWQWQLIYREMVGEGTAADRQPVVVVN